MSRVVVEKLREKNSGSNTATAAELTIICVYAKQCFDVGQFCILTVEVSPTFCFNSH